MRAERIDAFPAKGVRLGAPGQPLPAHAGPPVVIDEGRHPAWSKDHVVLTVSEGGRTLKFGSHGFENE